MIIHSNDNATYTNCHLSQLNVTTGQPINPRTAPSYGCITNQPATDWLSFIAAASLDSARRADPVPA